jgi:hypothetical protein
MPSAPVGARDVALRCALWALLGGWTGAWALFAFVVARVAFEVLPTTELAGRIVGPVLAALHLYGAAAGVALAVLAWALARRPITIALPLALAALCLVSHFGVTAAIESIRDLVFGPGGSADLAARFQLLHRLSMGIYTIVGLGAYALLWLHVRADAGGAQP